MVLRLLCSLLLILSLASGTALARHQAVTLPSYAPGDGPVNSAVREQELSIMGAAEATEEQLVAFIRQRNPQPKINCSLEELVATYFREGAAEGVRGDVALCQALKETGFFRYGGTVKPRQNNYCGLGTVNAKVGGASFTTVERGVRAHIQHLMAYASTERPRQAILDPRYEMVRKVHPEYAGSISDWSGLNGTWAVPGKGYGQSIVDMWKQAKKDNDVQLKLLQDYTRRIAKGDARASLKRGKLYAQQQQYVKALADYQAAEKNAVLRAEAWLYTALAYEAMGDGAKALQAYEKAMAAEKRNPVIQACLNNFRKRPALQAVDTGKDKENAKDRYSDKKKDKRSEAKSSDEVRRDKKKK